MINQPVSEPGPREPDSGLPYPDEADKQRMANPTYDPATLIVGATVTRLFQASGVPLSATP